MEEMLLEICDTPVNLQELTEAMVCLEKNITPSLSSQGIDIAKYAEKIFLNARIITLKNHGEIIGLSAFYANDDKEYVGYLTFIAIQEKFLKKGFGKKLLMKTECEAALLGMKKMRLEVFKRNHNAIEFYKRMGYVEIPIESENSLFMEKCI